MTKAETTKPNYTAITHALNKYRIIASGDEFMLEESGSKLLSNGTRMSSGKLHKSALHKSLQHKSLHKSLHKTIVGQGVEVGGAGLTWPSIEVPWREIRRLYDLPLVDGGRPWEIQDIDPPPSFDQLTAEVEILHLMQANLRRPENAYRRAQIVEEAGNSLTAYMLPLGADAGTPGGRTAVLFQIVLWLGNMIGLLYKERFDLPRPHVLDPTLEPYIPVPTYSSYPSNHAFQSFLIAEVFSLMVPEHSGAAALFPAAWKVAVNREYAGLHYRSDTLAGQALAARCAPILMEVLRDHIRPVRAEWLGTPMEGAS